ncbi:MAG TPA: biotin--[acetyl-CoA-carboxylase] ligase [Mycobacteriales bacterium]|nr:biotin--[acetyl-CoA-carboxylase] ligase [Mycobacteriales bacterium]
MYDDLARPPLRAAQLNRALASAGWRLDVVEEAASTNALAAERARSGEVPGLVIVAETQSAGRGRLDRTWVSPPRAGLTFSALVEVVGSPTWLPLLAGVAVASALRSHAGIVATLKWPNDVLVDGRKVGGILSELATPTCAVLGVGLNVSTTAAELPAPQAGSLLLAGASTTDRDTVLRAVLRQLRQVLDDPEAGKAAYPDLCSTLGHEVQLELPHGATVTGTADGLDENGRIIVAGTAYGAGDVVHLRPRT